jgi:outer membrane receptor protein involved in Fe transport
VYQAVNQALSDADYVPITIVNPLDGQPFTIYNQTVESVGRFDNVVKNFDELGSRYHGFEISFDRRLADNFALFGGYTLGSHEECTSASTNPNDRINNCGKHLFDSTHIANVSGLYRLPGDVMLSGHYQYKTGQPLRRDFTFTPALVPNLTQVSQRVLLSAAGEVRKEDLALLDFRLAKRCRLRANTTIEPTLDVYNLLNENAALSEVETVGPALGRISRNVDGRTLRVGLRVQF